MTYWLLRPPLALSRLNDEHIYNCHIQEEKDNHMSSVVGAVLHTIRCPQLICEVHTLHMSGVLKVHGKSHNNFTHRAVHPRDRGHLHARITNGNCICGKK
jgi:hypothetical protein